MEDLTQQEANAIHSIIMSSGDAELIQQYERTLESHAGMRNGMHAMSSAWVGTSLNSDVQEQLRDQFGIEYLYERNLLSADGTQMELNVLAGEQPDEVVLAYFKHDPKQIASEMGVNYDEFVAALKSAYKGTVGTPGQNDFGVLLSADIKDDFIKYTRILGIGMLANPYDKATVDRLSEKGDLGEHFAIAVKQGQEVHDKGIDAKSVYLITPDRSPLGVQLMAEILEFQGASNYTSHLTNG